MRPACRQFPPTLTSVRRNGEKHSPVEGDGFELSVPDAPSGRSAEARTFSSDREFAPLAWRDRDFESPAPRRVNLCVRTLFVLQRGMPGSRSSSLLCLLNKCKEP